MKISEKLSKMCMKHFWKNVDKIGTYRFIKEIKKIKAEGQ